jgi:tRNA A-37 threonylcarbamoyl transferase component Bud32
MLRSLKAPTADELLSWIRRNTASGSNIFSLGYQGDVYLYAERGRRLIMKAPTGTGLVRLVRRWMIRNEYRTYNRLLAVQGHGVPRCYGLLDGHYLLLQYVDGVPIRQATIVDRDAFFERLFKLIEGLHAAGVAHGDLKKKDNILVVDGQNPCIIDFGVAVVRKEGFAPINRYLHKLAKRFDLNAWVKLKLDRRTREFVGADNEHYNITTVEKMSRLVRPLYTKTRKRLRSYGSRHRHLQSSD